MWTSWFGAAAHGATSGGGYDPLSSSSLISLLVAFGLLVVAVLGYRWQRGGLTPREHKEHELVTMLRDELVATSDAYERQLARKDAENKELERSLARAEERSSVLESDLVQRVVAQAAQEAVRVVRRENGGTGD